MDGINTVNFEVRAGREDDAPVLARRALFVADDRQPQPNDQITTPNEITTRGEFERLSTEFVNLINDPSTNDRYLTYRNPVSGARFTVFNDDFFRRHLTDPENNPLCVLAHMYNQDSSARNTPMDHSAIVFTGQAAFGTTGRGDNQFLTGVLYHIPRGPWSIDIGAQAGVSQPGSTSLTFPNGETETRLSDQGFVGGLHTRIGYEVTRGAELALHLNGNLFVGIEHVNSYETDATGARIVASTTGSTGINTSGGLGLSVTHNRTGLNIFANGGYLFAGGHLSPQVTAGVSIPIAVLGN